MRIGFDVRSLLKEETGVGIYCKNLLSALAQKDYINEYFLFSSSFKSRFSPKKIPEFSRMHFRDFQYPVRLINLIWHWILWPPMDRFFQTKLDLTHSVTPLIIPSKGRKIVTVHDLFFMDYPGLANPEAGRDFYRRIRSSLKKADGVIAVSGFTKEKILEKFKIPEQKVRVIYHGLDRDFLKDVSRYKLRKTREYWELPRSFLLFVGSIDPRKNLPVLIEALKIVHDKYKAIHLVIAGPEGKDSKRVMAKISSTGLESWVKRIGFLNKEILIHIYNLATAFVFPSLMEGFGLPVIESMACGLPVAISRNSSLPEIAGDAALYFDPSSPEDIAETLIRILKKRNERRDLVERGKRRALEFDWNQTAIQTLDFYQSVIRG